MPAVLHPGPRRGEAGRPAGRAYTRSIRRPASCTGRQTILEKIDHIGIAVPDLEEAIGLYAELFDVAPSHRERVESDGIEAVMLEVGESRIELLGSLRPDSRIAGFLERRGGGIHHVAYGVRSVQECLDQFAADGVALLDRTARRGAAGRLVGFLHPRAVGGVLVELCQPGSEASPPAG